MTSGYRQKKKSRRKKVTKKVQDASYIHKFRSTQKAYKIPKSKNLPSKRRKR